MIRLYIWFSAGLECWCTAAAFLIYTCLNRCLIDVYLHIRMPDFSYIPIDFVFWLPAIYLSEHIYMRSGLHLP